MNIREMDKFYSDKSFGLGNKLPHRYDPKCLCKHCVEEDIRLRLHAQADDLEESRLRERFGVIPKVYR